MRKLIRGRTKFGLLTAAACAVASATVLGASRGATAATLKSAAEVAAADQEADDARHLLVRHLPLAQGEVRATSLFHVSRRLPQLLDNSEREETDKEWDVLCRTQLAYLRSYFLIQSALRAPGIAQLKIVADKPDQIQWLIDRLECGFDGESEIMYISLRGPEGSADDLRQIVDAVSDSYMKEVVWEEEQRRLVVGDALRRSYHTLQAEIRNKMDRQISLASELGVPYPMGGPGARQRIDMRRLERIDDELLRLEGEQLAAKLRAEERQEDVDASDRAQLKFLNERIAQLHESQANLEERVTAVDRASVELTTGGEELAALQAIARDMAVQLENMNIEDVAPDRIRRIQKATITRTGPVD